jgi:hypothetical protein
VAALDGALVDMFSDDPPDFVSRVLHGYHNLRQIRLDAYAGECMSNASTESSPAWAAESERART